MQSSLDRIQLKCKDIKWGCKFVKERDRDYKNASKLSSKMLDK